MKEFIKLITAIIIFFMVWGLSSWIINTLIFNKLGAVGIFIGDLLALGLGFCAGRHVWKNGLNANRGAISSALYMALIWGVSGFALGFFGPMIFSPHSNQGPLLGIFITGPLGLIVGAIVGFIRWSVKSKRMEDNG